MCCAVTIGQMLTFEIGDSTAAQIVLVAFIALGFAIGLAWE